MNRFRSSAAKSGFSQKYTEWMNMVNRVRRAHHYGDVLHLAPGEGRTAVATGTSTHGVSVRSGVKMTSVLKRIESSAGLGSCAAAPIGNTTSNAIRKRFIRVTYLRQYSVLPANRPASGRLPRILRRSA